MKSRALRAAPIIVAASLLLTVLWIWLALKWSFSEGERAGLYPEALQQGLAVQDMGGGNRHGYDARGYPREILLHGT